MEGNLPNINEIKSQFKIPDLLNIIGINYKEGSNIKCPFHNDDTPSLSVYSNGEKWICFGCDLQGDILDFIGYMNNISGHENTYNQIEKLYSLFGLELKINKENNNINRNQQEKAYEILKVLCKKFNNYLNNNENLYNELKIRFSGAFSEEEIKDLINKNLLGFNDGNNFKYLKDLGYSTKEILSTGMFNVTNDNYFDIFLNRFVFPLWKNNKIIYATSRVSSLSSESDLKSKYKKLLVNSEKSEYSLMKNIAFSANISNNIKYLIVCEGTIEYFIMKHKKIPCISPMGKQFKNGNLEELKRISNIVPVVFIINDNENSGEGIKSALQTAKEIITSKCDVRIVEIPKDKDLFKIDLADYFNTGISNNDLINLCENSMDYIEYQLNNIPDELKPQTSQRIINSIIEFIVDKDLNIDNYIKFISEKSKYSKKNILEKIKEFKHNKEEKIKEEKIKEVPDLSNIEDPFIKNYIISNNCIIREVPNKKDITYKSISSFNGIIEKEIIYDDGTSLGNKRVYEGNFITSNNKKFPFKINAEDFTSTKEFRKSISNICGSEANILPGEEAHVITAIQSYSNLNKNKIEEVVYQHTGWSRDYTKYYFPNLSIDKEFSDLSNTIRVDLAYKNSMPSNQFSRFKFKKLSKDEMFNTLDKGIFNGLLKSFGYEITLPCIATVFLPIILPFINNSKKYMLWIHGTTGKGKTNLITSLNSFYGDFFINQTPSLTWDSTAHSFENFGFYLKDAMFSIDNFKLSHAPKGYHKIIHSYTDNTARTRLNSSAELKDSFPIRGVIISSGEDLPSGESSSLARLIPIELCGGGNYEKYKYTKKYVSNFQGITPYFINWLLNNYDLKNLSLNNELENKLEYYIDFINNVLLKHVDGELIDPTSNIPRIATNISINSIGFDYFLKFSEAMGISKEKVGEISLNYDRCMPGIISKYSSIVVEESPTTTAVNVLLELISSGKVYIDGLNGYSSNSNAVNIGEVRGNSVYIRPAILISEIYKLTGKTFNVSNNELFRQFFLKGYILPSEDGKNTVNIRIGGVQCRCLQFKKDVLFPSLKEPNIDMIEKSFSNIKSEEDEF